MSHILLIDTSAERPMVALAEKGGIVLKKNGASASGFKLHQAIDELFKQTGKKPADLDAVSVISGPGSYTGLRVGMSAAKGFCYALGKELITIGSLEVMAKAVIDMGRAPQAGFLCPMLDARRDEVFAAVYDANLKEVQPPAAVVLQADSFQKEAKNNPMIFFGSGSVKWKNIIGYEALIMDEEVDTSSAFASLSTEKLAAGRFENLIGRTPDYLKEFFFFR